MKKLSEMSTGERAYLKEKWSVQVHELERDITRSRKRLENRMEKTEVDAAKLLALEAQLTNANRILTHLQNTAASAEMLNMQEGIVLRIQQEYEDIRLGTNTLTDEEFYLQQVSIEELERSKQYRLDKIAEVDLLSEKAT